MILKSVDVLQKTLADSVFKYAKDRKKAAGRALGTLVELITFYTLRAWNLRDHIVIERSVPEFANTDILHNVEFSLHPIRTLHKVTISPVLLPLTPAKISQMLPELKDNAFKVAHLLARGNVMRNACILAEDKSQLFVAHVDDNQPSACRLTVCNLFREPFAIFECKRVGIEEGMRKGPQTIEKAKQGAYVARAVSSLQKIRLRNGQLQGMLELADGSFRRESYASMLKEIIDNPNPSNLRGFVLTVGIVSNHGNWFTSENPNKELRVLAQSYDWLIFLTDAGLSQFIDKLLLNPTPELSPAREAFLASYSGKAGANRFTKVKIDLAADQALRDYFIDHESEVETWFNVIAPKGWNLKRLRTDLSKLGSKRWTEVFEK